MNKSVSSLLLYILCLLFLSYKAGAQDPNFHIYLCFGQSNMEGMGPIEAQDKSTNIRVKVLADQTCANLNRMYGQWYTAIPPLNRCWNKLGPADYFGKAMADAKPLNITIGLVPAAYSGCDIAFFQKTHPLGKASTNGGGNADIPSQFTGGYVWMLDLAKKAQSAGVIKGIIFHQGETNTNDPNWKNKVKEIVTDLRTDLGIGNVPFLAGELLYKEFGSCCGSHNVEVNKLPGIITNAYVISASGLNGQDEAHFTSASYRTLGKRYAEKMLALENTGCIASAIIPSVQINGALWQPISEINFIAGDKILLGPQPINGGSWSWTGCNTSGTSREQSLTPKNSCVATATYVNECGANSNMEFKLIVKTVTENNLSSSKGNFGISVFPQPFKERLHIEIPDLFKEAAFTVYIYTLQGQLVLEEVFNKQYAIFINTSHLPSEVYVLKIGNENYETRQLILKTQ